ncbi:MAG: glycosyltransferase [Sphingobacteriales bacterium]|nr:glycosyltransferase [Sphingobacteriales bacterium]
MKNKKFPIVLLVFNRPQHTLRCLRTLQSALDADCSELYIFSDGAPPDSSPQMLAQIAEVRRIIAAEQWCGKVHITERAENLRLDPSMIAAVSEVLQHHEACIYMEDDVLAGRYFLRYMNEALHRYAHEMQVGIVTAYNYPVHTLAANERALFLRCAVSQAWALWRRSWKNIETVPTDWERLRQSKALQKAYSLNGSTLFAHYALSAVAAGKDVPFDMVLWWNFFKSGQLMLFPDKSLIANIGFDGSGIHCGSENPFDDPIWNSNYAITRFPDVVQHHTKEQHLLEAYLKKTYFPPYYRRFLRRIKRLFKIR